MKEMNQSFTFEDIGSLNVPLRPAPKTSPNLWLFVLRWSRIGIMPLLLKKEKKFLQGHARIRFITDANANLLHLRVLFFFDIICMFSCSLAQIKEESEHAKSQFSLHILSG